MSPRLRLLLARRVGPWVPLVSAGTLRADAIAGLLGAILVLPQGIAFAMLAGLPPEYGLYSAIVPCAVAALFGSSWHVGLGADQREFARAVRHAHAAGGGRLGGLHRTGACRHRARRG